MRRERWTSEQEMTGLCVTRGLDLAGHNSLPIRNFAKAGPITLPAVSGAVPAARFAERLPVPVGGTQAQVGNGACCGEVAAGVSGSGDQAAAAGQGRAEVVRTLACQPLSSCSSK
jgi:hypothetical protein